LSLIALDIFALTTVPRIPGLSVEVKAVALACSATSDRLTHRRFASCQVAGEVSFHQDG